MIGETISKAARSAKVARALLDGGDFDDAVSRDLHLCRRGAHKAQPAARVNGVSAANVEGRWKRPHIGS